MLWHLLIQDCSDNYKKCFLFYRDALQFEVAWGKEESNFADFLSGGCALGIFDGKQMMEAINESFEPCQANDKAAIIFKVKNVEDA